MRLGTNVILAQPIRENVTIMSLELVKWNKRRIPLAASFFAALMACALPASAQALGDDLFRVLDADRFMESTGSSFVRSAQSKDPKLLELRFEDGDAGAKKALATAHGIADTALTAALSRAWKGGFVEKGVQGTRNMLLECQRSTSATLTMSFMRSDAQQSHCFRF